MRRNKKTKIVAFIFTLMLIGIGYAYLTANLKVTGTAKIGNARFDVHFENPQKVYESSNVTYPSNSNSNLAQGIPVIKGENNTELEWNVVLNQPGDAYVALTDIVNSGDIDAKLDLDSSTIKIKIGDNDEQSYKFSDIVEEYDLYTSFNVEIGALSNYIDMNNLNYQYLNAGDSKLIFGSVYLDEKTLTNEEWENLKGKTIKVTADLKYIQGEDNPHSNSNSDFMNPVGYEEGTMKVRIDNPVVNGIGPTTTFTSNSNSNSIPTPSIVNKSFNKKIIDSSDSYDFTRHKVEYTVIFNNPGDYYEYTFDIINEEDYDIHLKYYNDYIKIGFYEEMSLREVGDMFKNILTYELSTEDNKSYSIIPANSSVKVTIKIGLVNNIPEENLNHIIGKKIHIKNHLSYEKYVYVQDF